MAGHALGYRVGGGTPDQAHGYLPTVAPFVGVAALGSLAVALVGARPRVGRPTGPGLWRASATSLVAAQACLYIALELVERAAVGHGPGGVVGSPEAWAGLAAQAAVAVLALGLLKSAATVGARLELVLAGGQPLGLARRSERFTPASTPVPLLLQVGMVGAPRGPPGR